MDLAISNLLPFHSGRRSSETVNCDEIFGQAGFLFRQATVGWNKSFSQFEPA
jgi:hypothetical protein